MLAMVRSRDAVREDARFRAYLFTVARNELYRRLRTMRRRPTPAALDEQPIVALAESPSEVIGRNREETLLLRALRTIPLRQQILIELHYWERMTMGELAESMELPVGTIKSRLRAARKRLETAMAELEKDPAVLKSTLDDFDRWAASIRGAVTPQG